VRLGDILKNELGIKSLVNSANQFLFTHPVSGIAGAIKVRGGSGLVAECDQLLAEQSLKVTDVAVTGAHNLGSAGFEKIFHAVPPVYAPTQEAERNMEATMKTLLMKVDGEGIETVVMPILGGGIYGWSDARPALFRSLLDAIADWGSAESAGHPRKLRRIVLMDQKESLMKDLGDAMRNYDDQEESPAGYAEEPVFSPPMFPRHLWMYDCHDTGRGWVPYDYDQACQLDAAFDAGLETVPIRGDRGGVLSDSPHIPAGEISATYEVDFTSRGKDHIAMQRNTVSSHPRKVVAEALNSVEEAKRRLPLYKETYESQHAAYLQARQEWEHKQNQSPSPPPARVSPAQRVLGWMFSSRAQQPKPSETGVPFLARASSLRRIFSQVAEDTANTELSLIGFQKMATKAKQQLQQKLDKAKAKSALIPLKLQGEASLQDAVDNFKDYVARRGAVNLSVEVMPDGVVLHALGKLNLAAAETELHSWNNERAWRLLEANKVQFPSEWGDINEDGDPSFQEVSCDSDEFRKVVQLMKDETGLGNRTNVWSKTVTKVERVVNPIMWTNYASTCVRLKQFPRNKEKGANEVWVKHGTGNTDPKIICQGETGLAFNYSRETGNFYGKALYTAEMAAYVDAGYAYQSGGTGQILLCKFAAGSVCQKDKPEQSLLQAPDGYDCIRGPVRGDMQALMSYSSFQVYPFYLVSYMP